MLHLGETELDVRRRLRDKLSVFVFAVRRASPRACVCVYGDGGGGEEKGARLASFRPLAVIYFFFCFQAARVSIISTVPDF